MTSIQEIAKKLSATHVISFTRGSEKIVLGKKRPHYETQYAGYSPANGLFWVAGENFQTAEEAATKMEEMGEWTEVDECIDYPEVA
jgi:hypothetical protein